MSAATLSDVRAAAEAKGFELIRVPQDCWLLVNGEGTFGSYMSLADVRHDLGRVSS